jgi:hypothetical protein
MDANKYPKEWQAAAAILGGELLPLVNKTHDLQVDGNRIIATHKKRPPVYTTFCVCAMAWNDELGMLEDIDD